MGKISIYTDGSSRGNPGPGGWAAVIFDNEKVKELGGREEKTTNNRMEMKAALEALRNMPTQSEIEIHTDSGYLINGITKWVRGWQANGWRTKEKGEVLNRDLWEGLVEESSKRRVAWKKVVGHSGHGLNERCDEIATSFADAKKVILYDGSQKDYTISESALGNGPSPKSKNGGRAYSYISMVDKLIQTHQTWAECENRVRGVKGARFKKSLSAEDERQIIASFQNVLR